MKGEQHRVLHTSIANPMFRDMRRGIASIRRFHAGLPIIVSQSGNYRNFYGHTAINVAIPALRILAITDADLVGKLVAASKQAVPKLPTGETYVACANCHGTTWRNTMRKGDNFPMRALCVTCGNVIKVAPLFHSPGHA